MKTFCLAIFAFFLCHFAFAQPCTPNTSFTSPGLYPDTMPEGTVGQAYLADITFVMPTDTSGINFTNFQIVSIQLPAGLNWQCNNFANGCNYDPQSNIYGCVQVTGTPLLAGDYTVTASVIADLTIQSGVVTTFDIFLRINPQTVSNTNNGFSLVSNGNCAPIQVTFTNNNPGLAAYSWDFGNGNTSTSENPPAQIYSNPGTYIVNYEAYTSTANTDIYTLTYFSVNSMSGYGELVENADTYFKIFENGNQVYLSSVITDTDPPVSWNLNLIMNNSSIYTVEVWESDAGELFFGGDDYISNATLSFNGCSNCALNSNGTISYTVNHVVIPATPSIISSDTIVVNGFPATPLITYDSGTQTLSTTSPEPVLQWYLNNTVIAGATNSTFNPSTSGYYSIVAIGTGGCASYSDSVLVVICDTAISPIIQPFGSSGLILTNPNNLPVVWTLNGNVIAGQTTNVLTVSQGGSYQAILTDSFGCQYPSNVFVSTLGIENAELVAAKIYPNPTDDLVIIEPQNEGLMLLEVTDVFGHLIYQQTIDSKTTLSLKDQGAGVYFIQLVQNNHKQFARIIVK